MKRRGWLAGIVVLAMLGGVFLARAWAPLGVQWLIVLGVGIGMGWLGREWRIRVGQRVRHEGIILLHPLATERDWRVQALNPAAIKLLGLSGAHIGQRIGADGALAEALGPLSDKFWQVLHTQTPVSFTWTFPHDNRYYDAFVYPAAGGNIELVLCDITELYQRTQHCNRILHTAPLGVAILDEDLTLRECNPALLNFLGYPYDELQDKPWFSCVLPEDRERARQYWKEIQDGTRDTYYRAQQFRHRDGRMLWADVHGAGLRDENGAFTLGFIFMRDITVRQQEQLQRKALTYDLQFFSQISLDLSTLPDEAAIYEYVGERLSYLMPDAIIMINRHHADTQTLTVEVLAGLTRHQMQAVTSLLGDDPVGKSFESPPSTREVLYQGRLRHFAEGVQGMLAPLFPTEIIEQLVVALKALKHVYSIGMMHDGHLYAGVHIFTMQECSPQRISLIETFIYQSSSILQRKQVEQALQT